MDEVQGKTVFLTGGAGFIGSTLVHKLVGQNKIVVYDNGHRNALKDTSAWTHPNLFFIHGDVLNYDKLSAAIREAKPDYVLHLAAIAGVDTVLRIPARTMKINFIGTYNVLEATVAHAPNVTRFVDFSTSEVFGTHVYHAEEMNATTLGTVGEARWTYAVSKLAAEHLVHNYGKETGLPTVSIRPFNVFGPRQLGVGAIHTFVIRALQNLPLEIHGDGNQIRAWCYIDDMIDGIMRTLTRPEAAGHVFNIGNPKGTVTINTLAEKIRDISGSSSKIVYVKKDYVDVELRIPSIQKAIRLLDYEPKIDLNEGLSRTIAWYRSQMEMGKESGVLHEQRQEIRPVAQQQA
ncbi:MAG: NAD-dependent epimerase/dehydratase family protein [Candidatus Abyssobacteria bacterium SURF_5]|uniref:NAD-dependent epimerase/dehydratase family protein n=1 Tax=Abyssobacteria bacterium (strain SURF_5) TaxID=2093360 RepID=A0A3A4NS15_ABYX5|nr:MAG: NAD-dependent epimerase/dehydratase family protein [Candidatus Abyssubacteria bacterium SURF_5]